ncbi:phosphate acyltransferase PlsX [Leptospira borgpetersenii]|uniref:phosphate acyltransferase PlsX n=1 Tax=Leptospira borgpetersenii TaxID=174 RepID=UPI000A636DCC|nr:phosphate acyltransferase PlsX [Leptospira borgpetersenii]MBE8363034.1 phosphate acyltransferase PlsX [Leptospira borgpetersenii serovar Balcanica]MBE8366465.1 phosphate acyltransferase PlsX [Leptospira borgpetersenii serovar Balcanica]MBE8401050.1 phosphate acyltransferase PlsX [Leptospira borgpetersenii serovar Tarassovi]MBE8403133.1 phosphate acyltransferase PlsX [Leptospira borgpetersenii serovar Tarassovi]MBE8406135.1 phosphate acyltransferase PlsX [Leptospira borgpetersenii serovar Ta
MMWIAVDVMSGDYGPEKIIEGAVNAVNQDGANVVLVGKEEEVGEILLKFEYDTSRVRIQHASEIIDMNDSPSIAVRALRDSSVVQATQLVADKTCVGMFSPGNTGATMASALLYLGRIPGVLRPPIAAPIPQENGPPMLLLDAGANVDCKPDYLAQFAVMGEIYSKLIFNISNPKIGILSNGEEDKKGNAVSLKAFEMIKKLPVCFVGNVEGRDLYGGGKDVDVVVCDGFIGNIVLKATEGLSKSIFNVLRESIKQSSLAQTGALLLKPTFGAIKKRLDYAEYGGALLLGVDGICLIGHGSSNALSVQRAVRVVTECAQRQINDRIAADIKKYDI